ncbi:hypothetical protein PI124_g22223, partial [Phytophthora idaei]
MDVEVDPADEIGDVFGGAPVKKTIHVLVVVPKDAGVGVGQDVERDSMSVPAAVPMGPDVDPSSCDD